MPLNFMNLSEIANKMRELNNWSLESGSMQKDFIFKDFKEALEFLNKVGEIAEKNLHHPEILMSYNRVKLSLTTHETNDLSEKDFEVAKQIDEIEKV